MAARAPELVPCTKVRDCSLSLSLSLLTQTRTLAPTLLQTELAYIDTLVNLKIRLDSVKRMTQIQNTS